MADLITTLHPINDANTDLYPNVKNENIPSVVSGKDAMEALEGDFSTLKTDEIQIGGENGTIINSTQIATPNKVINLNEIVDDAELAQGLNGKVDKVQGKGLSTNDFTDADKLALETTIPNALDDKVNKVQGKGLSTNDFTDADKLALETTIPNQLQLTKENIEDLGTAVSGKVDKVSGKGLSTNDYTNADKALVDTIPDKVDKVQGKGLSTNDYTNADKSYLDNLPNYFISLAKGGVANVATADMPANPNTAYFGAKHGTTSIFTLAEQNANIKVTSSQHSSFAAISVSGSGGVNMLVNRDGTSSVVFTPGDYKVTADHLDNGNHYKHLFEIDAYNGITFTQVTPDETKNINLLFSQYDEPSVSPRVVTTDDGGDITNQDPEFEYIYNGSLATPPEIQAEAHYVRNGRMLHVHMYVENLDADDVSMGSTFSLKLPTHYTEMFNCWGSGFITIIRSPIAQMVDDLPTAVIDNINVAIIYEYKDDAPYITFKLLSGLDGESYLLVDCSLFLEDYL